MNYRIRIVTGCFFVLSYTYVMLNHADAENPQSKSAKQVVLWNADDDLKSMNGRWEIRSPEELARLHGFVVRRAHADRPLMESVFAKDSVLVFKDGVFNIEGADVRGKAQNGFNDIKNRPANNKWMNTDEPRLKLSDENSGSGLVSYVVRKDQIRFRYPANSCSRSGIMFTLTRVADPPSDKQVAVKTSGPGEAE